MRSESIPYLIIHNFTPYLFYHLTYPHVNNDVLNLSTHLTPKFTKFKRPNAGIHSKNDFFHTKSILTS